MVNHRHHEDACGANTVSFELFPIHDRLPVQYRLATVQEVGSHRKELLKAMPGKEIAILANGSVDGAQYGGVIRRERRNAADHKLATSCVIITLFKADQLPPQYRLATLQEVVSHQQALFRAMPWKEVANLADGSVSGAYYGGKTRLEPRGDVRDKLATTCVTFRLFPEGDQLPPEYRLAMIHDVGSHLQALFEAMPGNEIANLADGSVDGAAYGGVIRPERRNDVGHKLAMSCVTFTLFPIGDELPPEYRLATVEEACSNRQALFKAMPGSEIANLADGSVHGAASGGGDKPGNAQ